MGKREWRKATPDDIGRKAKVEPVPGVKRSETKEEDVTRWAYGWIGTLKKVEGATGWLECEIWSSHSKKIVKTQRGFPLKCIFVLS